MGLSTEFGFLRVVDIYVDIDTYISHSRAPKGAASGAILAFPWFLYNSKKGCRFLSDCSSFLHYHRTISFSLRHVQFFCLFANQHSACCSNWKYTLGKKGILRSFSGEVWSTRMVLFSIFLVGGNLDCRRAWFIGRIMLLWFPWLFSTDFFRSLGLLLPSDQ